MLVVELPSVQLALLVRLDSFGHRLNLIRVQVVALYVQNLEDLVRLQGLRQLRALWLAQVRIRQQQRRDVGVRRKRLHQLRRDTRLDVRQRHVGVVEVHHEERGVVEVDPVDHPEQPVERLDAVGARIRRQLLEVRNVLEALREGEGGLLSQRELRLRGRLHALRAHRRHGSLLRHWRRLLLHLRLRLRLRRRRSCLRHGRWHHTGEFQRGLSPACRVLCGDRVLCGFGGSSRRAGNRACSLVQRQALGKRRRYGERRPEALLEPRFQIHWLSGEVVVAHGGVNLGIPQPLRTPARHPKGEDRGDAPGLVLRNHRVRRLRDRRARRAADPTCLRVEEHALGQRRLDAPRSCASGDLRLQVHRLPDAVLVVDPRVSQVLRRQHLDAKGDGRAAPAALVLCGDDVGSLLGDLGRAATDDPHHGVQLQAWWQVWLDAEFVDLAIHGWPDLHVPLYWILEDEGPVGERLRLGPLHREDDL
mmetsp:Transcript_146118/g.370920  ORF Transcript_146118/g.370920 Transcript_146118/m.370920 type:complete len:476 (-) Transcript_146118:1243-2670(-)